MSASAIDSLLDTKYTVRNSSGLYEVFVLSEQQGRGTDLKTSVEIEKNGGNYVMGTDIFDIRTQQQVISRTGRLDNRGQWHYQIYAHGSLDSVDQLIKTAQQNWENEAHIKIGKLVGTLEDYKAEEEAKELKICINQLKRANPTKTDRLEQDVAKSDDLVVES